MKILVWCNSKGTIESVMIPHPAVAGQVQFEAGKGTLHRLEVDAGFGPQDFSDPVRRKSAIAKLQALVPQAGKPVSKKKAAPGQKKGSKKSK
jgi:hypothetical protein